MKKSILIILLIIPLLTIHFSGCIDIGLFKGLMGEEEEPKGYHTVTKIGFPVKHEFDTLETSYKYDKTHTININKNTKWMNITFSVTINDIEFQNFTNSSIREWIIELLNSYHRHVEITLTDPDGDEVVREDYEESVELQLFAGVEEPQYGIWKLNIFAIGVGYPGMFQDGFMVDVKCYEPA